MPNGMMAPEVADLEEPMAPDEVGVEQGFAEDERAALSLAIEQFPAVGRVIEKLMEAAAPPAESPEDTVKANLAPGEFVFTADAVKEIGVGKLQSMMQKAEEGFIERQSGGKPVEGGEEMAYSNGGYVNEDGQRGFVETMYKDGKEAQAKYSYKDSGMNYADGGIVQSFGDRLTEGVMGFFGGTPEEEEATRYNVEGISQDMRNNDPELDFYMTELQGGAGKGRAIKWLKQHYPQ